MAPFMLLIGKSPSAEMTGGALLSWIVYSNDPIFWVPTGVIRFWPASALATSWPDRPRACIAAGVEIDLNLPRLAAIRVGNGRTRDGNERRANTLQADVGERLLGQALSPRTQAG